MLLETEAQEYLFVINKETVNIEQRYILNQMKNQSLKSMRVMPMPNLMAQHPCNLIAVEAFQQCVVDDDDLAWAEVVVLCAVLVELAV